MRGGGGNQRKGKMDTVLYDSVFSGAISLSLSLLSNRAFQQDVQLCVRFYGALCCQVRTCPLSLSRFAMVTAKGLATTVPRQAQ